jgi:two-component system, NtrC family, response regulator HydG
VPTLRFHRGSEFLIEYRLRPGRTTIGRADTCDVALPGDVISRTHCIIQRRQDDWEVVDRSRHGVRVNGWPLDGRGDLLDGSEIVLGPYRIEVSLADREAPPTSAQAPDQSHEVLVSTEGGRVVAERAMLVILEGPGAGRRVVLDRSRVRVGSRDADVVIEDADLDPEHCYLRVAHGRVMIEPGRGAIWHDGQRMRDITPLYGDEQFRIGRVVLRVEQSLAEEAPTAPKFGEMVAESAVMRSLFGQLRRMAGHHHTVLVVGESGTGKELVARGLHAHSPRAERPFVALNCGAISANLFESELFGHEKGAFTGADRRRDGAFQDADGGTLFLDEIGELPEPAQAKLLRALETGEVRRVGSTAVTTPDVRIVAATNRDLAAEVAAGRFREDLFFRLAVLPVSIPPLRERIDDLVGLSVLLCRALDPTAHVTEAALDVLNRHNWPGNVRELRNVLTRAYVLGGPRIDVGSLSFHQIAPATTIAESPVGHSLDDQERAYIETVLKRHNDNRSAAARELGVARSTLHYKLKKYGIT